MGLPFVLSLLIWGVLTGCGGATSGRPGHLSYTLPTVTTVRAGETLPGTGVRYDRMNDRGAYLVIGGQRALKRRGDSVTWESSPVSSTTVDLSLRVVWYTENEVNLAGTAKINVEGVEPRTGGCRSGSSHQVYGASNLQSEKRDYYPWLHTGLRGL